MTYTITNADGNILEKDITEDQVIDFCNDEFAETDNIETAIEEDLLYFDNIHDAIGMLEQYDFTVTEN